MNALGRLASSIILSVAGWLSLPGVAEARQVVIAFVSLTAVDAETFAGFRAGMAVRGWREGDTVRYLDAGPAGSREAIAPMVGAQLAKGVDLLLCASTPVTRIAAPMARDKGVPVVFAPVNDPVAAGVVPDLRHPGGNVTGIRLPTGDDLRLQFLAQLAPKVRRVLLPFNPDDGSSLRSADNAVAVAAQLGLEMRRMPVRTTSEVTGLFANLPGDVDAVFLPRDSTIEAQIGPIVEATRARRLPLSAPGIAQVRQGALFSYGFLHAEIGRQAARLADQILRGLPAGDLPVESAENHLAINLAAAGAIGLEVPQEVLVQADLVVDR
ncbi:MAG: ABC transporter substrate-binding protein [Actinomycetota bacterium]